MKSSEKKCKFVKTQLVYLLYIFHTDDFNENMTIHIHTQTYWNDSNRHNNLLLIGADHFLSFLENKKQQQQTKIKF